MKKENSIILSELALDKLKKETLNLIQLYKSKNLTIPFMIKGNLGEFIVYKELLSRFPKDKIEFFGGAKPNYDIILNNKKIQIKTKIVKKFEENKYLFYEGCPTCKKHLFDEKECDFIIFVALYLSENMSEIIDKYTHIYIFDQNDFELFDPCGCFSGNKGDRTIWNIIEFKPNAPEGTMKKINHYNQEKYKKLFSSSLNNWNKIKCQT